MTTEDKQRRLQEFCLMAGLTLDPTIFKMWVGLPERAFNKKLAEWADWYALGGRLEF